MVVIRWKDIFERLEQAIDATERVADVIDEIIIKNAYLRRRPVEQRPRPRLVVGTALAFDFTNGFHDTANASPRAVGTRAMSPRFAVGLAATLNFVGAFISLKVAATIAPGIVNSDVVTTTVIFAGLVGAITWNLVTWWYGLPSSSSHALIGGVVGAALAAAGGRRVDGSGLSTRC